MESTTQTYPEWMTPEQAIEFLQLGDGKPARERLRNLMRRKLLPHYKHGKLVRFRLGEINAWLVAGAVGRKIRNPERMQAT